MRRVDWMAVLLVLLTALAGASPAAAQTIAGGDDGTTLKEIIIFGRHSVRSPTTALSQLDRLSAAPYPDFGVPAGYLTPHGQQAAAALGAYFHDYLVHEGLLTGDAKKDLSRSYFRANSIQRSNVTAAKFGEGLIPGVQIPVHSYPLGHTDPVFDPIGAGVVSVNAKRAVNEVKGIFGSGDATKSAYSAEYSLMRSALFQYPPGTEPPPAPDNKIDIAALPISLSAQTSDLQTGNVINLGGLAATDAAAGNTFVMEYAEGLPLDQVAWGRLSPGELSQLTRLTVLGFGIEMRSPYLARVQSSNAASHILRSLTQAVAGRNIKVTGKFGNVDSRVLTIVSSDVYLAGLAGLLDLHWTLPGYQTDYCAPGGALVFELRQNKRSKDYLVRVYYTAQTLDQLRNLTQLTLDAPPATMQLLVPGGSHSAGNLDIDFMTFNRLLMEKIGSTFVSAHSTNPGVLTDVPLH